MLHEYFEFQRNIIITVYKVSKIWYNITEDKKSSVIFIFKEAKYENYNCWQTDERMGRNEVYH